MLNIYDWNDFEESPICLYHCNHSNVGSDRHRHGYL